MSTLAARLDHYLAVRRSLGYDLSTAERILRRFVVFAEGEGADHITTDLFLRVEGAVRIGEQRTWAARLVAVRIFATWLQNLDPRNEAPPQGLIPSHARRPKPFIYSDDQIAATILEAARLPSSYGMRGWTCSTLFGLIAATGMRVSEAVGLDEEDVDLEEAVLTVKQGKNGKPRFVPISADVAERLRAYRSERDRLLGPSDRAFFLFESGGRLTDCGARYNFAQVCQRIGLRKAQPFTKHGRGPRIHDLRHTFAVRTIIDWYRRGPRPGPRDDQAQHVPGTREPKGYLLVHRGGSGAARAGIPSERRAP